MPRFYFSCFHLLVELGSERRDLLVLRRNLISIMPSLLILVSSFSCLAARRRNPLSGKCIRYIYSLDMLHVLSVIICCLLRPDFVLWAVSFCFQLIFSELFKDSLKVFYF